MQRPVCILWFRRDLRLQANAAFTQALQSGCDVLPVYCHDPQLSQGAASRWWLHQSLQALQASLQDYGLTLHYLQGPAKDCFEELIQQLPVHEIVCHEVWEPAVCEQTDTVRRLAKRHQVSLRVVPLNNGFCLPGSLLNGQRKPYRVFTPFWKQLRRQLNSLAAPEAVNTNYDLPVRGVELKRWTDIHALGLLDARPWWRKLEAHWQPGEARTRAELADFLNHRLFAYGDGRDLPGRNYTSRLSPHLHFGEISIAQIVQALQPHLNGDHGAIMANAAEGFIRELGWREFAGHVLWHFPHTVTQSMDSRYDTNFWHDDDESLNRWQRGETGVPLVDAGMQQLWQSGWMHNRVRMVCASFLTKNLGLPWQAGAAWFNDTLVDADLASNTLGWQWAAGCGVDAAPYYRIFNPHTQLKRFDPEQRYVRQWLGDEHQHPPMIDLGESRKQALQRYNALRQRSTP